MSGLTNYAEKRALDYLLTGGVTVFVELHTGDPGEDATDNEVTVALDADYVRKAVTMGAATLGVGKSVSTTAVSWTVNAASAGYTITHLSLWDALSGGNAIFKGELVAPETLAANDVYTIDAGLIIAELD